MKVLALTTVKFNHLTACIALCLGASLPSLPSSSCLGSMGWGWAPEGTEETCSPRQTRRVIKGIPGTALLHNKAMTAWKQVHDQDLYDGLDLRHPRLLVYSNPAAD